MPKNIRQNGKIERSDNIKLSHARKEAGTQEPRDVWTCDISTCPVSHTGPHWPRPATPFTPHRDLQEKTTASLPEKARLSEYPRKPCKPHKLCCIVFKDSNTWTHTWKVVWEDLNQIWRKIGVKLSQGGGNGYSPEQVGLLPVKTFKC